MTKTDKEIDEALHAEEMALLRGLDAEPGYFTQLGAVFAGSTGWVNLIMMAAQAVLFLAGVVFAIHFYQATNAHAAIFWGIPAAVLLVMSLMIKLAMWPVVQANRVLRAIKRVEVLLAERR